MRRRFQDSAMVVAVAVGLTLTIFAAGCLWKPSDTKLSPGRAYFSGFGCLRCHTIGNEGGKTGPDLTYIGFRKSREWLDTWLKNPPAWKTNTVMPNFYLKDDVREAIVDYLASLKGQDFAGTFYPWNTREIMDEPVKRGEIIFERVGCIGCHGKAGVGGYPNNNVHGGKIPALTYVSDGYTREELKKKIRKGVKPEKADPHGPDPLVFMPPWGEVLQENELEAVVEYLFSLRPHKTDEEEW